MKKIVTLLIFLAILLTACGNENEGNEKATISYSPVVCEYGNEKATISYSPIVCEYTTSPTCWTVIDCIDTNVRIYADNTIEIYCSNFYDECAWDEVISVDYIYGETFEITEEQKQSVIDAIKKNKIASYTNLDDLGTCDGNVAFISLFDENGEEVHSCGGLNPSEKKFVNVENAIMDILPEGAFHSVNETATEQLTEYLLETYPEYYEWLE